MRNLLFYVVTVESTIEISQNFVAFSEYMNFTRSLTFTLTWMLLLNRNNALVKTCGAKVIGIIILAKMLG